MGEEEAGKEEEQEQEQVVVAGVNPFSCAVTAMLKGSGLSFMISKGGEEGVYSQISETKRAELARRRGSVDSSPSGKAEFLVVHGFEAGTRMRSRARMCSLTRMCSLASFRSVHWQKYQVTYTPQTLNQKH